MVERMMYINLMGRADDLDRVIEEYVGQYDIQLEYASKDVIRADGSLPFTTLNPYSSAYKICRRFQKMADLSWKGESKMSGEQAVSIVDQAEEMLEKRIERLGDLRAKMKAREDYKKTLEPFANLFFDMRKLSEFRFISICFGKMPLSNYKQLEAFLYDDPEILFVHGQQNEEFVWGVYATPRILKDKIDSIFSSLHFERIWIEDQFDGEDMKGPPEKIIAKLDAETREIQTAIDSNIADSMSVIMANQGQLAQACQKVREMYVSYEAKKYVSKTQKDYFVFVGWMAEKDARVLQIRLANDARVIFITDAARSEGAELPPTKLKNPPLIRFFEFFTKMYGLPGYGEMDPTPFLAVTYTILFGLMFGDLGQGAVIAALGFLLYKVKGKPLGAIMTIIGLSSMVFGLLYGSVFGFEDWIEEIWRRPGENANIMSTLLFAVGIGIFLNLSAMVFNIINALRQKNWGKLIFSPNGLAGFVFYAAFVGIALSVYYYQYAITAVLIIIFVAIPLTLIALREPLTTLLTGRRKAMKEGLGMFALETVIELFEVLLTYFTNTVSFVRVGAFALSHAGMMSVVRLLSYSSRDNTYNLVAVILGNILVIALEGLVVGIQVLRLEFYEMFSRFFEGGGRAFESYRGEK